jgi:hypothetical protein
MIKARFMKCLLKSVTCLCELLSADSLYTIAVLNVIYGHLLFRHEDYEYLRLLLFLLNGKAYILFNYLNC